MRRIEAIVAVGKNYQMGLDNSLPWNNKEDLSFFKKKTLNKTLIMGRKTVESLPFKLPNRKIICLTTQKNYKHPYCDEIIYSTKEINNYNNVILCGGLSVYKLLSTLNKVTLYLSIINYNGEADVFFPKDVLKEFQLKSIEDKNTFQLNVYEKE